MNSNFALLDWKDQSIPHLVWLETVDSVTRIGMKIVKDVEPEILYCELAAYDQAAIAECWQGSAIAVSPVYDDGNLFSQTRVLVNLPTGCVVWAVTHIKMSDGNKMSADRLVFVAGMRAVDNQLVAN